MDATQQSKAETRRDQLTFGKELICQAMPELIRIATANHEETGLGPTTGEPFAPDPEYYKGLEAKEITRLFTARLNGELIGYALFLLHPHPHHPHLVWAYQDALYVVKAHRGRLAVRFIQWTDAVLRDRETYKGRQIDFVYRHVKPSNDYSRTLERQGYVPCERSYIRRLRDGS